MSATKNFLANPDNYTEDTKRGLADPSVAHLIRGLIMRKRMHCADGFVISVQYSTGHYCNGRSRLLGGDMERDSDPYPEPTHVEVGFPSVAEPLIADYAEEATVPKWVEQGWQFKSGIPWSIDEAHTWHAKPVANRLYDDLRWGDRLERWLVERFWPQVSNLTETVYGWVPVEVIDEVIAKHGGLVDGGEEYE